MEEITAINWIATIVGAVVAFVLGGFWYSDQGFAKQWRRGVGLTKKDLEGGEPGKAMAVQAVGTFLYAWVIGVAAASEMIWTAALMIFTIVVLIKANGLFAHKKKEAIAVESSYVLVMGVIMIFVHIFL